MTKAGELMALYRVINKMPLKDLAVELEVSNSTVRRIENGKSIDGDTTLKLINWLFEDRKEQGKVVV